MTATARRNALWQACTMGDELQQSNASHPKTHDLVRQACELLEQQSKFLKGWGKFSDEQVREYVSRQRQIKALILAMNRDGNGDEELGCAFRL